MRYPKIPKEVKYDDKKYKNQLLDIELTFRGYVGEPLLNPCRGYSHTKSPLTIHVNDLGFQGNHANPRNIRENYRADPANARLYGIFTGHKNVGMITGGGKIGISVV